MPYDCLFNRIDWPAVIAVAAALALTALMLACLWVASDADDYSENRRGKDD
jgi:hypothetical protein